MLGRQLSQHDETAQVVVGVACEEVLTVLLVDPRTHRRQMHLNASALRHPRLDTLVALLLQLDRYTLVIRQRLDRDADFAGVAHLAFNFVVLLRGILAHVGNALVVRACERAPAVAVAQNGLDGFTHHEPHRLGSQLGMAEGEETINGSLVLRSITQRVTDDHDIVLAWRIADGSARFCVAPHLDAVVEPGRVG